MLPILMLVGMGALQFAFIYEAKSSLNYATFLGARAGAFDHANPEAIRIGFAKGLAPLYSPDATEAGLLRAQRQVGEDFQADLVHLAILNPTLEAFSDFAEDLDLDGARDDLPNLDLQAESPAVGSRSGVNIQDANLLKLHVTYGARLSVPFVGPMFATFARAVTEDPIHIEMLEQGRLPLIATATVRMQNFATRNDLVLSRDEVAEAVRTALTPAPNPIDDPGNGGGNDPLPSPLPIGPGIGGGNQGGCDESTGIGCSSPVTPAPCDPSNLLSNCFSASPPPVGQPPGMVCNGSVSPQSNSANQIDVNASSATGEPQTVFNPIHVVTGNKYQVERDISALSGVLGLRFERYYNSHDSRGYGVGHGWRHSYSAKLARLSDNHIRLTKDDGRMIRFIPKAASAAPVRQASTPGLQKVSASASAVSTRVTQWQARSIADGRIIQDRDTGYYHWQQHNGHQASFDHEGKLIGLRAPNGASVNLYYSRQGHLQQVVDPQQRKLTFHYYPNGRLKTLVDPAGQRIRYSYDEKGNLDYAQYLDAGSQGSPAAKRQYHYEDPHDVHNLTGITNADGERYVTWYYDEQDRAIGGYHAQGADHVSLDYSTPGQTLVTNSAGEQSVYHTTVIQGIPLVTAIDGPGCSTCGVADSQYVYDDNAQLIQSRTQKGLTTHYHYDEQGRLTHTEIQDEQGQRHQPEQRLYQGDSLQPSETRQASVNPNGQHRTLLTYNAQQQLTQIAEHGFSPNLDGSYRPISRTTRLSYDGPDLIAIDGPREDVNDIIQLTYDNQHQLKTLTSPDGRTLTISDYDDYGRPQTIQTGEASPLTLQYNSQGQPTQVSQGPNTLHYEYSASGQLIGLTGPDGERVDIQYDDADRATRIIQANGPQLRLRYDSESRITQQSLSNANGDILSTVNLLYDAEGRLRQQRREQNNQETIRNYQYDHNDRLASLSNQHSDQLNFHYNPLGQLLGINNGQGNRPQQTDHTNQTDSTDQTNNTLSSALGYDHKGQAISLTDPNGNTTEQLKDDFGRIVAIISPDSGTTRYHYDEAGNRIRKTDAKGQSDTYTYDAANRLIRSQTQDGNTQYTYHPTNGQLIQVAQQTEQGPSQERFEYDKEGRLTQHHRDLTLVSNTTKTFTTEYEYNLKGKLSHKQLPDGQTLRYHYYQDGQHQGQLRAITKATFFGQDVIIGEIDPNHWDGDLGYTFGNGLKAKANYQNGRLANQQDGKLKLVYQYDEAGNIIQIDQNGTLHQYRYDQLGRLTYASSKAQVYRYQYDKLGNRTAKTVANQSEQSAQNSDSASNGRDEVNATDTSTSDTLNTTTPTAERLTDVQLNQYAHSESNRLKQVNNQIIDYNEAGSPKTYPSKQGVRSYDYNANQRPIRLYIDKALRAEYAYNAFGERISKTVYPSRQSQASRNKKSSSSDEDGEGDPSQSITTYYLYDGRQLTAEVDEQGEVTKQYLYYTTAPVALLKKKRLYHIHSDHLGTPKQITDEKGKTVWQADYSPFGKAQINNDPDNNGNAITLNLRFAGQYEDQESGTYYNYFRDYDPETGRYLTSDPIGLQGGINTYAYVNNNPLSRIDPLGLMPATPEELFGGNNSNINVNAGSDVAKPQAGDGFVDRIQTVLERVPTHLRRNGQERLAQQLESLLDPTNIAITVGVFAGIAALQAVPGLNVLVDAVLIGYAFFQFGFAGLDFGRGLLEVGINVAGIDDPCPATEDALLDDQARILSDHIIDFGLSIVEFIDRGRAFRINTSNPNRANINNTRDQVDISLRDNPNPPREVTRTRRNQPNGLMPVATRGHNGRIESVFAQVRPEHIGTGQGTTQRTRTFARALGEASDDAGHLVGANLGGSRDFDNIIPQNPTVNRGEFRVLEADIANRVRAGDEVFVRVVPKYSSDTATRPDRIVYQVRTNGQTETFEFANPPP